ncbi:unnamed protein product [Linum trigynum]|uniref:Uncharacterized protein n=1 Tax=Linum trigynum TaxID=586398 RepID=A0AAV2GDN8_9ROSI
MWRLPNLPRLRWDSEAINASLQSLEVQIEKLGSANRKPSQTVANPKDHAGVNAIQVGSGKVTLGVAAKEVIEKVDPNPKDGEKGPSRRKRKAARKASPTQPPVVEY